MEIYFENLPPILNLLNDQQFKNVEIKINHKMRNILCDDP